MRVPARLSSRFCRVESLHYWIRVDRRRNRQALEQLSQKFESTVQECNSHATNETAPVVALDEPSAYIAYDSSATSVGPTFQHPGEAHAHAATTQPEVELQVNSRSSLEQVEHEVGEKAVQRCEQFMEGDSDSGDEEVAVKRYPYHEGGITLVRELDAALSADFMSKSFLPEKFYGFHLSLRRVALAQGMVLLNKHGIRALEKMRDEKKIGKDEFSYANAVDVLRIIRKEKTVRCACGMVIGSKEMEPGQAHAECGS